jgi:hypothetical protein
MLSSLVLKRDLMNLSLSLKLWKQRDINTPKAKADAPTFSNNALVITNNYFYSS